MDIRRFAALAALLALLLGACSSTEVPPALNNKGILPLSDSDPFLGSNLYLSQEMEKSSYLYSFFKSNGAPTAIELIQESMHSPRMLMFFARQKEVYVGAPVSDDPIHQWIIRGPYQVDWRDNKQVQRIQLAFRDEPVFSLWGKRYRFPAVQGTPPAKVLQPVLPPTPRPARARKPKGTPAPVITAAPAGTSGTFDPANFKPRNFDQQALLMAQGYAERTESGDLIHTVQVDTQTLARIAKWYTGAEGSAAEIAKVNGLPPDQPMAKGARVRVPLNLLKQFKVMPEDFQ